MYIDQRHEQREKQRNQGQHNNSSNFGGQAEGNKVSYNVVTQGNFNFLIKNYKSHLLIWPFLIFYSILNKNCDIPLAIME